MSANDPDPGAASGSRRRMQTALMILVIVLALAVVWYLRFPGLPANLGIRDGRLAPCPASPNCVSSFEEGPKRVEPLGFEGTAEAAMTRLAERVRDMRGASIVTRERSYLHAEFRTPILGFVDDVEFLLDADSRRIHVRSASRRGYSDLGTNRERVEELRSRFAAGD